MRIGVFGGTFDPIHHGHVHAVAYAMEHASLDQCRIIVAGEPWQKDYVSVDAHTRLLWAYVACDEYFSENPNVIVDDREVKRKGATYTVDTLRELHEEFPDDTLVLIVGEDIPRTMSTWKDSDAIIELSELCVVPRSIFPTSSSYIRQCRAEKKSITGLLPAAIEAEIVANSLYNEG